MERLAQEGEPALRRARSHVQEMPDPGLCPEAARGAGLLSTGSGRPCGAVTNLDCDYVAYGR